MQHIQRPSNGNARSLAYFFRGLEPVLTTATTRDDFRPIQSHELPVPSGVKEIGIRAGIGFFADLTGLAVATLKVVRTP